MNTISVIAHGSPGSFVRRVQEDPQVAVGLLRAVEHFIETYDPVTPFADVEKLKQAAAKARGE